MSVQLRIGDGLLHIAAEFPEMAVLAPPSIGGTPLVLALDVADAEAVFKQGVTGGRSDSSAAGGYVLGATGTASSRTRSGIAGTSLSTCTTCHTMRSPPPPHRRSAE